MHREPDVMKREAFFFWKNKINGLQHLHQQKDGKLVLSSSAQVLRKALSK